MTCAAAVSYHSTRTLQQLNILSVCPTAQSIPKHTRTPWYQDAKQVFAEIRNIFFRAEVQGKQDNKATATEKSSTRTYDTHKQGNSSTYHTTGTYHIPYITETSAKGRAVPYRCRQQYQYNRHNKQHQHQHILRSVVYLVLILCVDAGMRCIWILIPQMKLSPPPAIAYR